MCRSSPPTSTPSPPLVDVLSHKEAEGSQERLLHELQHRVKNILATITALTSRMVRTRFRKGDAAPG
ncbi:hypothetical protein EN828_09675 [Mesorhizobium sp. M2D.F.Ca.ET.185.01.1.1]|nr:hypothetical protein EN783_10455 [Mesorhizobium sp. M2D.F.Ca.ET.140.01.1.1]TGP18729.1 hypothetical protein EN876_10465 [Mesorhizobium sp. M2D.F.Ca.ET.233.01.1.1]TGP35997.1 hypothetical protein EN875_009675 [Mesorhizobium sp. M2D.F.Ca.ET.232.01.1.1]TGP61498.1 hypothetical protein EN869_009935 [Mesorhizobium sp. M2D.F.Ca.ET.226.01.1.1]TGP70778.1 hypothetical protein EN868_06265 [Mesorhizobium sp. M2D.F.Ca.ET.225.01.1.1]TGP78753.1 hypothetical protein EN867_10415 [Mesorhizobium sp. M2D.F.Ca.ET